MRYLLAAMLAAAISSPASAFTLTLDDGTSGPQPYQGWLDAAKVPLPINDVALHLSRCPTKDAAACAIPGEIWIDPDELAWVDQPAVMRRVFLHEVGHQFDYTVMTDTARKVAGFIRNDPRPWRKGPNSSHERFAEAWGACAMRLTVKRQHDGAFSYRPRPRAYRETCRLIQWAAAGLFAESLPVA